MWLLDSFPQLSHLTCFQFNSQNLTFMLRASFQSLNYWKSLMYLVFWYSPTLHCCLFTYHPQFKYHLLQETFMCYPLSTFLGWPKYLPQVLLSYSVLFHPCTGMLYYNYLFTPQFLLLDFEVLEGRETSHSFLYF